MFWAETAQTQLTYASSRRTEYNRTSQNNNNDLVGTDITFGFTAVSVATEAIDRLHTTAHSHNRIMVIEVMGHKAGWLALYAGIAGGGDVIIIPEIPYDVKIINKHLSKRKEEGKSFSIVVVAEGAKSLEEAKLDKKVLKHRRSEMKESIGYRIARELEKEKVCLQE